MLLSVPYFGAGTNPESRESRNFVSDYQLELRYCITLPAQAGARSAEVQPRRGDCAWPC
jgi:hypothetical protein